MGELLEGCGGYYNATEILVLTDVATKIADYECFMHLFEQGCEDFLTQSMGY